MLVVLLGAATGAALPTSQRWPAVMVGAVAGMLAALWLAFMTPGFRSRAAREVAALLVPAGMPKVPGVKLWRITSGHRVIVRGRLVHSEQSTGAVTVTVGDRIDVVIRDYSMSAW